MIYSYMNDGGKIIIYSIICRCCNTEVKETDTECFECGNKLHKRGKMTPYKNIYPPYEYICAFCGLEVNDESNCPHCEIELDWSDVE